MRCNVKALGLALAVLWCAATFLVGVANLIWHSYGVAFLDWAASFYPGYDGPGGFGSVVVLALYAFVDGAVAGMLLASLYNAFAGRPE